MGMKDSIFDKEVRISTGHGLFLVREIPPLGKMIIGRSEGRMEQFPDQDISGHLPPPHEWNRRTRFQDREHISFLTIQDIIRNMTTDLGITSLEDNSSDVRAMPSISKGKFYVFEGIDGSGKTTVSRRLLEMISQDSHREVLLTVEPTDSWLGDSVRRSYNEDVSTFTEALLFIADRATHTERIKDWLSKGIVVLCDRYNPSTLAYQGTILRRTIGDAAIGWLKIVSKHVIIEPDITFLFSITPEVALERLDGRDKTTKFEKLSYLEEVDSIYRMLAGEDPRIFVVDASDPLNDVINEVMRVIRADLM